MFAPELRGGPRELAHVVGRVYSSPGSSASIWLRSVSLFSERYLTKAADHVGEAGHVRTDETRRVRVDDDLVGGQLALFASALDDRRDVVAVYFRKEVAWMPTFRPPPATVKTFLSA